MRVIFGKESVLVRWLVLATATGWVGLHNAQAQELEATFGDEIVAVLKQRPDAFRAAAEELILGYGSGGGIEAEGVERMIAVRRAALRASVMRRLLLADLDNDGGVSQGEVAAVLPALGASSRSRLYALHRRADGNGDGTVNMVELRTFADRHARDGFDENKAAGYRRILLADTDGDGRVTLQEVADLVEATRTGG